MHTLYVKSAKYVDRLNPLDRACKQKYVPKRDGETLDASIFVETSTSLFSGDSHFNVIPAGSFIRLVESGNIHNPAQWEVTIHA